MSLFLSEVILSRRARAHVELAQILVLITVQENSETLYLSIFLPSLPKRELIKGLHFVFNQSQGTERS